MKYLAKALLCALTLCGIAQAQTYPTTPNIVATKQAGWTIVWTWVAPTQNVDGSAISGALTYDVYMSTGGAFTELASGLTATQYSETNLPAGVPCVYVVAEEAGTNTIPSPPSNMACVKVTAPAVQPNAPTSVSGY